MHAGLEPRLPVGGMGRRLLIVSAIALGMVFVAHALIAPPPGKGDLRLTSPAFKDRDPIPADYTCDGKNSSPPLHWTGVPAAAKSLVLIVEDPDARGGPFTHWVIYDLPPAVSDLAADIPKSESIANDAKQGLNGFKQPGYGGPCPPSGRPHRYFFRIYALDQPLNLKPAATRKEVEEAMATHVVGQGQMMGTYQRKGAHTPRLLDT
jgi:Raf kinase inhibitor-like YbhB/YbcL family protein